MLVLIADDESTTRLLLAEAIRRHDHEVLLAEDGEQAWELYREHRPHVVLTDRHMPGLDGVTLVRRIRTLDGSNSDHHQAYVVLVTVLGAQEEILEGMHAGADDYLARPVDTFELQTRLIAAERTAALHHRLADTAAELEQANADLNRLARTDQLTGLGNRRRLDEDLAALHARAVRYGDAYAIALADIDHFKPFNDTYGHPEGDRALQAVANSLQATSRAVDGVYRYGGEELAVLLPATGLQPAAQAAERLRAEIEALGIEHHAQPDGREVLTMSVGVAAFPTGGGTDPDDVLAQVDEALYRAKNDGRNCVAVHDPRRPPA